MHDNPIVAVNQPFEELTGYSKEEIIGRNCRFLAGPETNSASQASLRSAIDLGRQAFVVLTNYRRDGSRFRNALMVAPVRDKSGSIIYFIGNQMDVTELEAAIPQLSRARSAESVSKLSNRQKQVLRLMARGCLNRQIGEVLGLSERTVQMHRAALLKKLGNISSSEAVRIAVEAGL